MKRRYAALASGLMLVALLPSVVSADRPDKFEDHFVAASCDATIDGGFVSVSVESSTEGDFQFMGASIWLDPANPFESDPTAGGGTDIVDLTDDGTTIEAHASFPTFDVDGNPAGDADLTITVARTGETSPILPEPGKTNVNDKTSGVEERLEGSGMLTWDGSDIALTECSGQVVDINVFRTSPRGFVSANAGVTISCEWETATGAAFLGATDDGFGYLPDVFLETSAGQVFSIDAPPGSVTEAGLDAMFELSNSDSAVATATFTPTGSPVTSTLYGATFRTGSVEQSLVPVGSLESLDRRHARHQRRCVRCGELRTTRPSRSPRAHRRVGHRQRRSGGRNRGEAGLAVQHDQRRGDAGTEFPILTCPRGLLIIRTTLWYTIEGTGGPVTIDTAGSAIDTLISVFVQTDAGFDEIACVDDVESNPLARRIQAGLTIDTEEGVTYYVEVGGVYKFLEDARQRRRAGSHQGPLGDPAHVPGLNTIRAITIAKLSSSSRETRKSRFIRRDLLRRSALCSKELADELGRGPRYTSPATADSTHNATDRAIQVLPKLHAWSVIAAPAMNNSVATGTNTRDPISSK